MSNRAWVLILCGCQLVTSSVLAQGEPPPLEGGAPADVAAEAAPPPSAGEAPSGVESAQAAPGPLPPPPAVADDPADAAPDTEAVFRAFGVYAAGERDRRVVGAVAGVAAGVTTMALGAALAEPTNTDPTVWYVVGGISAGMSLLTLFLPSPAESIARSFRVSASGHSAAEARRLEIQWNDLALSSKRRRIVGGGISLALAAGFLGSGIAILSGAGDFTDSDRYFLGGVLVGSGAAIAVSGVANIFVKSSAERSFEAYRAVRPQPIALRPVVSVGPGGWLAGASGMF